MAGHVIGFVQFLQLDDFEMLYHQTKSYVWWNISSTIPECFLPTLNIYHLFVWILTHQQDQYDSCKTGTLVFFYQVPSYDLQDQEEVLCHF